jgi:hypothetical protein
MDRTMEPACAWTGIVILDSAIPNAKPTRPGTPESDEALEAYSAKQLSKIAARSKEFKIEKPYGETYDTVLKWVKENVKFAETPFLIPHEAEVADKETGQIMVILTILRMPSCEPESLQLTFERDPAGPWIPATLN